MGDLELNEVDRTVEEGKKGILKYFDRIHDKLFTFNNILIAAYFAIAKFDDSISALNIILPLLNLCWLIFIEWRMMELSRTESRMDQIPIKDLQDQLYSKYGSVTRYSLGAIVSTLVVFIVLLRISFFK